MTLGNGLQSKGSSASPTLESHRVGIPKTPTNSEIGDGNFLKSLGLKYPNFPYCLIFLNGIIVFDGNLIKAGSTLTTGMPMNALVNQPFIWLEPVSVAS